MPRRLNGPPGVNGPKRVTQQDIATIAGVHKMTVSDALNGTGRVDPTTREKIRQIAKELNYLPNLAARALSTGRMGNIAVISGHLNEPYYASMVHHLEQQLKADGYRITLMSTRSDVKDLVSVTGNLSADGAIAIDMLPFVSEFRSQPAVPCVSMGTFERSFVDNVVADLSASVEEALNLMLSTGRRRIAYLVSCSLMTENAEVRARTYYATLRRADIPREIINTHGGATATIEANFRAYLEEHGCPEGLLCQNDDMALCAFGILRDLGYRVPNDVLLVGCDGQLPLQYFNPPLSTIVQPVEEMCATAWDFLKRRMADPTLPHQQKAFPGKLVVRQSLLPSTVNAK